MEEAVWGFVITTHYALKKMNIEHRTFDVKRSRQLRAYGQLKSFTKDYYET